MLFLYIQYIDSLYSIDLQKCFVKDFIYIMKYILHITLPVYEPVWTSCAHHDVDPDNDDQYEHHDHLDDDKDHHDHHNDDKDHHDHPNDDQDHHYNKNVNQDYCKVWFLLFMKNVLG